MKISVIIPIYNGENYIDRCLESIVNQTYSNLEIILVNDGSTDNSQILCEKWENKDSRIKVIYQENGGVSSARNKGIYAATGNYFSFIDIDDYLEKNMYELLMKQFDNNIDVVVCNFNYVHDNIIESYNRQISGNWIEDIFNDNSIKGYLWNKLYTRKIIFNHFFKEEFTMLEDMIFNIEMCESNSINYRYINNKLYNYTINPNSALRKKEPKKIISSFYAQEEIIKIAIENDLSNINALKLNYVFNSKYYSNLIKNESSSYEHINNKTKEYGKNMIFFRKVPIILKLKTIMLCINPSLYFFIKKVTKNENK